MLYIIISYIWSICKIKMNSWHHGVCLSYTSRLASLAETSTRPHRNQTKKKNPKPSGRGVAR